MLESVNIPESPLHVMSSNRYASKFYKQSSEWAKLMTIYSTAQPIETQGKLAGILLKWKFLCYINFHAFRALLSWRKIKNMRKCLFCV